MSAGNINWAFGDGGDGEDLAEAAGRYGYTLNPNNGIWYHDADDTDGDTAKTDVAMWQYIWDRRESEAEDLALS